MKNDQLMDAFKAFEVKNQHEIQGGYYKIVYGQGRNANESYATIYQSNTAIESQQYVANSWESNHPAGVVGGDSGSGSGSNGGNGLGN